MIEHTESQVRAKVSELWPDLKDETVEVQIGDDYVRIKLYQMYEAPGLKLSHLMALCEFFGTKNIDDERFSQNGCDTCDYGSRYGFDLVVRP